MKWKKILYWTYRVVTILCTFYLVYNAGKADAEAKQKQTKTIPCSSEQNIVRVSTHRTTDLTFVEPPKDVVPGDGSFDFKRVQNDLFIKALGSAARSNVFVFVGKRRCRFDLVASESGVDELLEVRNPSETVMEVQFSDK